MDSLNIFYVLQQSITKVVTEDGKERRKWLPHDSNVSMGLDLFASVYKLNPNVHFYVLVAPLEDFEAWDKYPELPNVTWLPFKFKVNAWLNRYQLILDDFLAAWNLATEKAGAEPDILWNNITELTGNMKQTLWQAGKKPKIVTCCYWLDCPEIGEEKVAKDITYQWRQLEGFMLADVVGFTCESTRLAWLENASKLLTDEKIDEVDRKHAIFDFGYLQENVDKSKSLFEGQGGDYFPTILFPNRLTTSSDYTNWKPFIKAVNKVWKKRQDFAVYFTNPSGQVSQEWLEQHVEANILPLYTGLPREKYFDLLKTCHIFCSLYEIERYGGCAHRECLASGLIPVTPRKFEYERIQGPDYPFYVEHMRDLPDVLDKAISAWYKCYKVPEKILERCKDSSFERASVVVLETLGDLCGKTLL